MRAVSAALGIEWRFDLADVATETDQHLGEDVIGLKAQKALAELHRHVPVAEMIGGTDQLEGSSRHELRAAPFRRRLDFDHTAVAGQQAVAMRSTVPAGKT
jgi:hypothetical protein